MSLRKRKLSKQSDDEERKKRHVDGAAAADDDDDDDDDGRNDDDASDERDNAADDRLMWRLSKTNPMFSGGSQTSSVQREAGMIEEVRLLNFMSHSKLHFEYVLQMTSVLLLISI